MTGSPNPYAALVAKLAAEPDLSQMADPTAGVLVWDQAVERVLWASPAAEGLRRAFTDESGRLISDFRSRDRLRTLAAGAAPREGMRLERLRFHPTRPWQPVACACRLATSDSGETVLVTALVGPVPYVPRDLAPQPSGEAASGEGPPMTSAPEPSSSQDASRGPVRFVWQMDAETRFTNVSPALAQIVGAAAGGIVGKTWDEVSRSVVEDPRGEIAGLFARQETWSGRSILWAVDNSPLQVPVDWAGMPVFGAGRELVGFRGFGLLRVDEMREREQPKETFAGAFVHSSLTDEALPFAPPEEMKAEETAPEEPAAQPASTDEENWFATLRDRVAEALSSPKAAEAGPVEREEETPEEMSEKAASPAAPSSSLSHAERNAFREIARALGARLEGKAASQEKSEEKLEETVEEPAVAEAESSDELEQDTPGAAVIPTNGDRVLDRLPIGILVHRGETILFANRFLLGLTQYDDVAQVMSDGGLVHLFRGSPVLNGEDDTSLALTTRQGENIAVSVRQSDAEWDGGPAHLLLVRKALRQEPVSDDRVHELEAILDTATDGVILLDETGRILSLNRSAEALFGYHQREVVGSAITVLLAPESHMMALDYLEGLRSPGVASLLNDGREVLGRERQGGTIPLFMTMGHASDGPNRKFCAVLRDMTAFKKAEGELVGAKRAAEEASAQKSDLLAKISHEIRTPLNAILGFAEVMLEERFGSIGNDRYKEYLRDVHASGSHVISLVNDLLDLAKVEAGRLELSFTGVNLNDLVSSCVTLLQPQAARDRIVMRMSFSPKLPPVVADERSMRQIVLNLVSNAIKFTDAGGQVIVSTAMTDRGEVAFRVRDTGIGMTESEVEAALEPFRQIATSRRGGGTGLGLPLTKALVEANRGALQIASQPSEGTLVEVIFPPTRVLAE